MKTIIGLLTFFALTLAAAAATNIPPIDLDTKIAQLSKPGTTMQDVTRVLGEPEKCMWGNERTGDQWTYQKTNLPAIYVAVYPQNVHVWIRDGTVAELRSQPPGPGFTWRGKLHIGSSLQEVLEVVGQPAKTVTNAQPQFIPNVLYRDIGGRKGEAYYARPDQMVRFFFHNDKVEALYVSLEGEGNFRTVTPIKDVKEYQDVRFKDMSALDLSSRPDLPATLNFNQKTVWPKSMPAGVTAESLLSGAMNPGLGIRKLHEEGLTGKGVNVAIIDQPLYKDHPEFRGKLAAYHDVGCNSESSMHGPAVASLLVGTRCGVAPDARVYYVAAPSWTADTSYQAEALDWIVERNAKLPPEHKIRVVSISAAPSGNGSPFKKHTELWDPACERAEKAGILVLDCTTHHGFIGPAYYDAADPENVAKCQPGFPGQPAMSNAGDRLLVPCSPRTTAEEYVEGECGYQYCGRGGLSWSIPYTAGVLALGWQARPDLTGPEMRDLLLASAHQTADGAKIINPAAFINALKQKQK